VKKIVLWEKMWRDNDAEEICLTFLTTKGSVWRMIPLMIRTCYRIKKQFSDITFYSLNLLLDRKRVHFFDIRLSLVSLFILKRLCMDLEMNNFDRIADIDVHTFNKHTGKLIKVTHRLPIYL